MVVGDVELEPLFDAIGSPGTLAEFYAGATDDDWHRARSRYPDLVAGELWRLPVVCYLIRSGGRALLVDTGVGPPGLWDWEPEREGHLLASLAERGVTAADIDLVLLTHVHADHVGWNAGAAGEPLFGRYVLHPDALAAAGERGDQGHDIVRRCILGLEDRPETIRGDAELMPGVTVCGHYPGSGIGRAVTRDGRVVWEPV